MNELINSKIFIVNSDINQVKTIEHILLKSIPLDYLVFHSYEELIKYKYFQDADLFIVGESEGLQYNDICSKLLDSSTVLFIVSSTDNKNKLLSKKYDDSCIIDTINHPPDELEFINKIKLLLKVSSYQKSKFDVTFQTKLSDAIWKVLYYSQFYILIMDCDLKVKIVNNAFADMLGMDKKDIIGKICLDCVDKDYQDAFIDICITSVNDKTYKEIVVDITTFENKKLMVKWFCNPINTKSPHLFCVGIPIEGVKINDSLDTIREYYKNLISKDSIMIKSLKERTDKFIKTNESICALI